MGNRQPPPRSEAYQSPELDVQLLRAGQLVMIRRMSADEASKRFVAAGRGDLWLPNDMTRFLGSLSEVKQVQDDKFVSLYELPDRKICWAWPASMLEEMIDSGSLVSGQRVKIRRMSADEASKRFVAAGRGDLWLPNGMTRFLGSLSEVKQVQDDKFVSLYELPDRKICWAWPASMIDPGPLRSCAMRTASGYYTNFCGSCGASGSRYLLAAVHNQVWERAIDHGEERGHAIAAIYDKNWNGDLYKAALVYSANLHKYRNNRKAVAVHGPAGPTDLGRTQANEMKSLQEFGIDFDLMSIEEYEQLP